MTTYFAPDLFPFKKCWLLVQGLLKIWTEHSHWFSVNLKPLKISWPKFQHCYNYKRNEFSPNLEVVAQKIGLLRPFEVLNVFGGKSISLAPRAFIFGEKRVSIEMHKWWNFGADISNHFPAIQNLLFCLFNSSPMMYKNNFQKLFLYIIGLELKR